MAQLNDIPVASPSFAAQPDTTTAQEVQAIGKLGGNAVKEHQKAQVQEQFSQIAEAASFSQEVKDRGFTFDTEGNITGTDANNLSPDVQLEQKRQAIMAKAGPQFKRIANAVSQGAMSENAAAIELESTVKRLTTETPGFGPEIRQAARDLAGFDPTGYTLQQILNINKPKGSTSKTAWEKRLEDAQATVNSLKAVGVDVPLRTVLGSLGQLDVAKTENDTAEALLNTNSISFEQYAQKTVFDKGPDTKGLLNNISQLSGKGGVLNTQDYINAVTSQREQTKQFIRQKAAQFGGVDTPRLTKLLSAVDEQYQPLIDNVQQNDLGELLKKKLGVMAQLDVLWGRQALPNVTRWNNAFGDKITSTMIDLMANTADPAQFELLYSFDPMMKQLIDGGKATQPEIAKRINDLQWKVLHNIQPDASDLIFQTAADNAIMSTNNSELRTDYLSALSKQAPVRAFSLMADQRWKASDVDVNRMRGDFNHFVGQDSPKSPQVLLKRLSSGLDTHQVDNLHINAKGQLVTTPHVTEGAPIPPKSVEMQTDDMVRLQTFIKAVNNGWDRDFGVNKDTFGQELIDRIKRLYEEANPPVDMTGTPIK